MHHVVCVMQPPRMFSITAMIALENFQPPTSCIKQIFCNYSTGEKKKIQYRTSTQENWVVFLFSTFPSLMSLGQSLQLHVPHFSQLKNGESIFIYPPHRGVVRSHSDLWSAFTLNLEKHCVSIKCYIINHC